MMFINVFMHAQCIASYRQEAKCRLNAESRMSAIAISSDMH